VGRKGEENGEKGLKTGKDGESIRETEKSVERRRKRVENGENVLKTEKTCLANTSTQFQIFFLKFSPQIFPLKILLSPKLLL
jgi:hypothetical protein